MSAEVVGAAIHEVFCRGNAPMHSDRHHSAEALISKTDVAGYDVARIEEGERPDPEEAAHAALVMVRMVALRNIAELAEVTVNAFFSHAVSDREAQKRAHELDAAIRAWRESGALAASDEAARP